jgi:hypothetical protein
MAASPTKTLWPMLIEPPSTHAEAAIFLNILRHTDLPEAAARLVARYLPDGSQFVDVQGLEQALLKHPDVFVSTLTEKLLTYATARGVEYYDAPAIRAIVRDARRQDYRLSSIVLGIVKSTPFQLRMSP